MEEDKNPSVAPHHETAVYQQSPEKNWWKIIAVVLIAVIIVSGLVFAGYILGQQKNAPSSAIILTSPTQTTTNNATASWKTYTIKSLGLTYKLPPAITSLGDLQEFVLPGQKGTQVFISTENSKVTSDKKFLMGTTSVDYMAGREGMFIDLQGFTVVNGKYYARFVADKTIELPSELVTAVPNKHGVSIIKILGKNYERGEGEGLPLTGTPGKGHIGALININKPPYQGLAIDMILNQDFTEQLFDQILSTFKFTDQPQAAQNQNAMTNNNFLSLEKLRFAIPTGWWSEQDEQSTTEKWFNINPTALPRPGDTPPAFTVNFEKNKTIEQKKNELIKNWGLSNIKEVAIQSNSISGIILEGTTEPGFLDARRIKIAVTSSGENVYYLFDLALTDNHEKYFNDILSTFNFIQ